MVEQVISWFKLDLMEPQYAVLAAVATICLAILVISWLVNILLKQYIVSFVATLSKASTNLWFQRVHKYRSFRLLSHLAPAVVIYLSINLIQIDNYAWTSDIVVFVRKLMLVYMGFSLLLFLRSLLLVTQDWYNRVNPNHQFSLRTYVQVVRIILWVLLAIWTFSVLTGKSPAVLLTGIGAASAILLLVFKDSIMGFVSSIQVSLNNMVTVGDWITMPAYGADGDVLDVSINTVKIQNFDKTIVTIPTYSLMTEGVKNWRGMSESGGRRIKRAINIDIDSIQFCDDVHLEQLRQFKFLDDYIQSKSAEISQYNNDNAFNNELVANGRSLTNIGLFRAYIDEYLRNRADIHMGMTFLVRQLQPTEKGLPLEIYVFTNDTNWIRYEGIQSDIFDHLLACLKVFKLDAFQLQSSQVRYR